MFKLLDKLSEEMGIECTQMGGLIAQINSTCDEVEGYYSDLIVVLALEADLFGLFDEVKTLEAYKNQLDELTSKASGALVIIKKAYEKVIQKLTVQPLNDLTLDNQTKLLQMKCLSIEERLVLVSNENERLYDHLQAIVRDQRQAMQVLESKIPVPEIEEVVVEEEKVPEVPKEKTEEDYSKEKAAKIDEMFYLID